MNIQRIYFLMICIFIVYNGSLVCGMLDPRSPLTDIKPVEQLYPDDIQPTTMQCVKMQAASTTQSFVWSAGGAVLGVAVARLLCDPEKQKDYRIRTFSKESEINFAKFVIGVGYTAGTFAYWAFFGKEDENRGAKAVGSILGAMPYVWVHKHLTKVLNASDTKE